MLNTHDTLYPQPGTLKLAFEKANSRATNKKKQKPKNMKNPSPRHPRIAACGE